MVKFLLVNNNYMVCVTETKLKKRDMDWIIKNWHSDIHPGLICPGDFNIKCF